MTGAPSRHATDSFADGTGTTCDRNAGGISFRFREFVYHDLCQLTYTV
jgi:hypothetical protein